MRLIPLAVLSVAVVFEAIGDVLFKQSATSNRLIFFYVGFVIYVIGSLLWAYSLRFNLLSRSIIIFMVLNVIIVVIAGALMFNEKISTTAAIGMFLGVVSVILLEL